MSVKPRASGTTARKPRLADAALRSADAEPLRIVKFVTVFGGGGTERQFVNLGLTLDVEQFDLRFACLGRRGALLPEVEERGIPTHEYAIGSFYSLRYVRQALRLAADLRRDGIDIVHAYSFYGNVFAVPAARLAGVPVVIASIRDRGVYLTPNQKRAQRYACRLADCVLVNAESIRDWLVQDGYDPGRIVVIRNGIDMSHFRPAPGTEAGGVHREFGFPAGAPLVILVSRLNPSKGVADLVDAAAIVAATRPDVRVLIVGGGEPVSTAGGVVEDTAYRAELGERVRRLGLERVVAFAGHRSDIPRLLQASTLSVLPSLSEGLPNAVLESMAAGVPVVATAVGGVPEIVTDGRTGLLVPPASPAALAAALERLLAEPALAARLGAAGHQLVVERFSMERMVRATEQLYHDLWTKARTGKRRRGLRDQTGAAIGSFAGKRL
jgi:L-malate glycosyltransferase